MPTNDACRCDARKEAVVEAGAIPPLLRTFAMGIPGLQAHQGPGAGAGAENRDPNAQPAARDLMDAASAAECAKGEPQRYLQVNAWARDDTRCAFRRSACRECSDCRR